MFDQSGTYVGHFGERGLGFSQLETPNSLVVDADGNIYVDGSMGIDVGGGVLKFNKSTRDFMMKIVKLQKKVVRTMMIGEKAAQMIAADA